MQTHRRHENHGKTSSRPESVPPELAELIEISHAVGSDPDLVQGGGGNTSVKARDGKTIFVKASGTALKDMSPSRGWAQMDLETLRALVRRKDLTSLPDERREAEVLRFLEGAVLRPAGARPSVESSLHAILDRVVIHVHSVQLDAFLCSRDSREKLKDVFRDMQDVLLYVPYVNPGYTLAARLDEEIAEYRAKRGRLPAVVLLENHGAFIAAPEVRDCLDLTRAVTQVGMEWAGGGRVNSLEFPSVVAPAAGEAASLAELRGSLLEGGAGAGVLRRDDSAIAAEFLSRPDSVAAARQGAFTPDQIVYCRTHPLVLEKSLPEEWATAIMSYREKYGVDPRVILRPPSQGTAGDAGDGFGGGVYYAAPDLSTLRIVAEVYRGALAAILRNDAGGGPRFLSREQAAFIEGWEVERFRGGLLGSGSRKLSGRIAAVTGAASGLGKGIALGLIGAGATVFGFDINRDALEQVRKETGGAKYVPLVVDVTSEESVRDAFLTIEASAGGIDVLVNAAGIAPPYPLVDFPLAAWKKTLDINLTGYFLCAREAARLLLRQGAGGSIINLTSKSGLDASKDNSGYNATKAGEIHLMRGWALELGKAGIRVNCVAPGNVFKGSQIWNEEYIRVCAKKKGIKPEEVIPYYTSLTALGKEIEPQDIANAVIFLASEEARTITGQTLVVDGGQVMVR